MKAAFAPCCCACLHVELLPCCVLTSCLWVPAVPVSAPPQEWVACRTEAKAAGKDYVEECTDTVRVRNYILSLFLLFIIFTTESQEQCGMAVGYGMWEECTDTVRLGYPAALRCHVLLVFSLLQASRLHPALRCQHGESRGWENQVLVESKAAGWCGSWLAECGTGPGGREGG